MFLSKIVAEIFFVFIVRKTFDSGGKIYIIYEFWLASRTENYLEGVLLIPTLTSQNEKNIFFKNKDEESVVSNFIGSTDTNGFLLDERFHDKYQPQPGRQRESLSQFRNVASLQTKNIISFIK